MNKTILATAIVTTIFAASVAAQPTAKNLNSPIKIEFNGKITDKAARWKFEIPAAAKTMASDIKIHRKDFVQNNTVNRAVYTFINPIPTMLVAGTQKNMYSAKTLKGVAYHPSFEFTDMDSKPVTFNHDKAKGELAIKLALKDNSGKRIPNAYLQLQAVDAYMLVGRKSKGLTNPTYTFTNSTDINLEQSDMSKWNVATSLANMTIELAQKANNLGPLNNAITNNVGNGRYKYSYNSGYDDIIEGRAIFAKLDLISTDITNIPQQWKASLPVTVTII